MTSSAGDQEFGDAGFEAEGAAAAAAAVPQAQMSWLADRLKAAEDLLHAVDRTAATIGTKGKPGELGASSAAAVRCG